LLLAGPYTSGTFLPVSTDYLELKGLTDQDGRHQDKDNPDSKSALVQPCFLMDHLPYQIRGLRKDTKIPHSSQESGMVSRLFNTICFQKTGEKASILK